MYADALVPDRGGVLLVAREATDCCSYVSLFRFTAAGLLDRSFGTDGKLQLPGTEGVGRFARLLPDGRILAGAGDRLYRFRADGRPDTELRRERLDPPRGRRLRVPADRCGAGAGRLALRQRDPLLRLSLDPREHLARPSGVVLRPRRRGLRHPRHRHGLDRPPARAGLQDICKPASPAAGWVVDRGRDDGRQQRHPRSQGRACPVSLRREPRPDIRPGREERFLEGPRDPRHASCRPERRRDRGRLSAVGRLEPDRRRPLHSRSLAAHVVEPRRPARIRRSRRRLDLRLVCTGEQTESSFWSAATRSRVTLRTARPIRRLARTARLFCHAGRIASCSSSRTETSSSPGRSASPLTRRIG